MNGIVLTAALMCSAAGPTSDPWVLAVGVNASGSDDLAPLAFADDDAVAVVDLFDSPKGRSFLHTTMDADTQARAPRLAEVATAPSLMRVLDSVETIADAVRLERSKGGRPEVWIWFSGHAAYDKHGHPYYPMSDGPLHARTFLDDIVGPLSRAAHRVHIVLDTCFAGAMVRARAKVERATPRDVEKAFGAEGLAAYPNVGALVGASAGTQAFEWAEIGSGVFSAMVRAGLRGAADVDGDGHVRYAELAAFLAAARYDVPLKSAQPRFSVYPPKVDRNAALMKRAWLGDIVTLREDLSKMGAVQILDDSGSFLVAATFEPGFVPTLWLPRGPSLFLRAQGAEHALLPDDRGLVVGEAAPEDIARRSLVGSALREGLFKASFGPAFYRGYSANVAPVPKTKTVTLVKQGTVTGRTWGGMQWGGLSIMLLGGILAGAGAISTVYATVAFMQYAFTDLERPASIHATNAAVSGTVGGVGIAAGVLALGVGARLFSYDTE